MRSTLYIDERMILKVSWLFQLFSMSSRAQKIFHQGRQEHSRDCLLGQFMTRMNTRWIFLHSRYMNTYSFNNELLLEWNIRVSNMLWPATAAYRNCLRVQIEPRPKLGFLQFSDDLPARNRELRFTFDESDAEQFSVEYWSTLCCRPQDSP